MKSVFIIFFLILLIPCIKSYAIEEIELERENIKLNYLSRVYYGEINKEEKVSPILKLFSEKGYQFENSPINSVKIHFLYDGQLSIENMKNHSTLFKHDFTTIEPMISLKFNEGKSEFMFDYNIVRDLDGYDNSFTEKISEFYISHKITDNQLILIGQGGRLPNSYDGARGTMDRELVLKSQLGRNFGDARSVGIRNIANYKYIEYDIGLYDSTRYMKDFGNGIDFTGHIMLRPFYNLNEQVKNIRIGSSYAIGKNNICYNTYALFLGYDYRKFHIHGEYSIANGYNGIVESNNKADGLYIIASYDIMPKVTLLVRYDYFIPNKNFSNIYSQEYTAGLTYKIFKNMKIMINYINRKYTNKPSSNIFLFATRFII